MLKATGVFPSRLHYSPRLFVQAAPQRATVLVSRQLDIHWLAVESVCTTQYVRGGRVVHFSVFSLDTNTQQPEIRC